MMLSRLIAGWMMRVATHRPPPGRSEWALAMQREFETLDAGEVDWALGCLATSLRWKLRSGWPYLALLALTPIVIQGMATLRFQLLASGVVSREAYVAYGATLAMLEPLPVAILLGACRPERIVATLLIGCLFLQHFVGTVLNVYTLGGSFLSWWGANATLYMAPPLVGLFASLAIWYLGAALGATAGRSWRGRSL